MPAGCHCRLLTVGLRSGSTVAWTTVPEAGRRAKGQPRPDSAQWGSATCATADPLATATPVARDVSTVSRPEAAMRAHEKLDQPSMYGAFLPACRPLAGSSWSVNRESDNVAKDQSENC